MLTTNARRTLLMLVLPSLFVVTSTHAETTAHGKPAKPVHTVIAPVEASSGTTPSLRDPDAHQQFTRKSVSQPEVRSASVVVMDETDSSVLYARKADVALPIASITKLMTALVVIEGGQSLDETIRITNEDRDTAHGSGSRLAVGTKLTRGELLNLALMSSENRAAHALGRSYTGGMPAFLKAANAKARELGMKTARFADPTGLSSRNVSSAGDLAKLVIAASQNPLIREYSTYERLTVPVGKQLLEFRNTNMLVSKPDWDIAVQKTGYTQAAGQCLVMQATIQDRPIVMVLLNSFGKYTRLADARRIRKWMEGGSALPQLASTGR